LGGSEKEVEEDGSDETEGARVGTDAETEGKEATRGLRTFSTSANLWAAVRMFSGPRSIERTILRKSAISTDETSETKKTKPCDSIIKQKEIDEGREREREREQTKKTQTTF
jgi:hypothetical protein